MASTSQSPEDAPNPNLAAVLTWLVPGAGHFYMGQVRTAAQRRHLRFTDGRRANIGTRIRRGLSAPINEIKLFFWIV